MTAKPAGEPRPHRATEMSTGEWKCTCGAKLRNEGQVTAHMIAAQDATAPNTGRPECDGQNQAAETRAAQPPANYFDIIRDEIEECARVVDACNRMGPYQAIGAASEIRARKSLYAKIIQSDTAQPPELGTHHRSLTEKAADNDVDPTQPGTPGDAPKLTHGDGRLTVAKQIVDFVRANAFDPYMEPADFANRIADLIVADDALLASRSTQAVPAPASTEAPGAPSDLYADGFRKGVETLESIIKASLPTFDSNRVAATLEPALVKAAPSTEALIAAGDAPKLTYEDFWGSLQLDHYGSIITAETVDALNALLASRSTPAAPAARPGGEGTQG